jgi:prepilin-type N-terminal cleavage/methylation domain-containing protein
MSTKKGFTLIEILVAVGIFAIVATLSVASLLVLTSAEKRAAGVQSSQDNMRFAVEAISREIRTGRNFTGTASAGTPCDGIPSCISFTNSDEEAIVYKISPDPLDCSSEAVGQCILKQVDGGLFRALTSNEVAIERLSFIINGEDPFDRHQPRVTIVIKAITRAGTSDESSLNIQTTVSRLDRDG